MAWSYDERSARYRDLGSGRYLSKASVVKLRDDAEEAATRQARTLAEKVANGSLSPSDFGAEMRKLMKTTHAANYSLGRGGINAMTAADRGALGSRLRAEYKYLDGFIRDIQAGGMTPGAIASRAELYVESSIGSYERGKAAALGVRLPEDSPPAHSRCRCTWVWRVEDGVQVGYWTTRGDDKVCQICEGLAAQYSPWRPQEAAA